MILDDIVAAKRKRLAAQKQMHTIDAMLATIGKKAELPYGRLRFVLQKPGLSVIAEVKKASPSKGIISAHFDPCGIAQQYASGGADAVSVLTEEDFFLGSRKYLTAVADAMNIPVLRKDFIIDRWQIIEARSMGAHAILLIAAILTTQQLRDFREIAQCLGMDALVEAHNEEELKKAFDSGAEIVGINNRDLKTFDVSLETTRRLMAHIPSGKVVVSESGILTADDTRFVADLGVDAVLVGESLMRADDIGDKLRELKTAGAKQ